MDNIYKYGREEQQEIVDKAERTAQYLWQDLLNKGINPLENPRTYDYIQKLPADQRENLITRISTKKQMERVKNALGDAYLSCLFHPGIQNNLESFVRFSQDALRRYPNAIIKPEQLVDAFSQSKGEATVYRGMALKNHEARNVREVGIVAPGLRRNAQRDGSESLATLLNPLIKPDNEKTFEDQKNLNYPDSYTTDMYSRVIRNKFVPRENSISSSVSAHPEVALSVGWHDSGRTQESDVDLHLYEITVPAIWLYSEDSPFNTDHKAPQAIQVGQEVFDEGVELFLPFGVAPNRIQEIPINELPPRWQRLQ